MNIRKFAVLVWAFLLGTAAIAGEQHRMRIEIAVESESGPRSFMFDSEESGIDLHSLEVGERRELTDIDGNLASVLRTEDGFELDFDGETIELDELQGGMDLHAHTADVDIDVDKDVSVRKIMMVAPGDEAVTTIISGAAIDEATRDQIREVLTVAGQTDEVVFIDATDLESKADQRAHQKHEVRIIRKEKDATN